MGTPSEHVISNSIWLSALCCRSMRTIRFSWFSLTVKAIPPEFSSALCCRKSVAVSTKNANGGRFCVIPVSSKCSSHVTINGIYSISRIRTFNFDFGWITLIRFLICTSIWFVFSFLLTGSCKRSSVSETPCSLLVRVLRYCVWTVVPDTPSLARFPLR